MWITFCSDRKVGPKDWGIEFQKSVNPGKSNTCTQVAQLQRALPLQTLTLITRLCSLHKCIYGYSAHLIEPWIQKLRWCKSEKLVLIENLRQSNVLQKLYSLVYHTLFTKQQSYISIYSPQVWEVKCLANIGWRCSWSICLYKTINVLHNPYMFYKGDLTLHWLRPLKKFIKIYKGHLWQWIHFEVFIILLCPRMKIDMQHWYTSMYHISFVLCIWWIS